MAFDVQMYVSRRCGGEVYSIVTQVSQVLWTCVFSSLLFIFVLMSYVRYIVLEICFDMKNLRDNAERI